MAGKKTESYRTTLGNNLPYTEEKEGNVGQLSTPVKTSKSCSRGSGTQGWTGEKEKKEDGGKCRLTISKNRANEKEKGVRRAGGGGGGRKLVKNEKNVWSLWFLENSELRLTGEATYSTYQKCSGAR